MVATGCHSQRLFCKSFESLLMYKYLRTTKLLILKTVRSEQLLRERGLTGVSVKV